MRVFHLYLFGALVLTARGSVEGLRSVRDGYLRGLPATNLSIRWTFIKESR